MAARKTRQPQSVDDADPSNAGHPDSNGQTTQAARPSSQNRPRLFAASAIFGVWFVLLATLAWRTANPVTLNREQILAADLVVEATIENSEQGRCRVIKSWPAGAEDQQFTVTGLDRSQIDESVSYFLPLRREDHGEALSIVETPPPLSAQLIYPVTDESRQQLQSILEAE